MKVQLTKLSIALLAGTMAAPLAFADEQGKVTFNGKVLDQTCSIKTASLDQTVTLESVPASALATKGSGGGSKMFDIAIEKCGTGINGIAAHFETDNRNPDGDGELVNMATSAPATNVGVQLLDRNGSTPIKLGNTGEYTKVSGAGDQRGATLTYGGRLYSSQGGARAGNVMSMTRFTLVYN